MIPRLHDLLFNPSTVAGVGIFAFVPAIVTGLFYVSRAFETTQPGAPAWLHFASAAAVELGVLFIGLVLAIRSAEGDQNLRLYAGIFLFVAISVIANYDTAGSAVLGEPLSWSALQRLDRWTLIKAGALGGAVPLMVLMLLESLRELAQAGGTSSPTPPRRKGQGKGRGGTPERILRGMPDAERAPEPSRNGAASHAVASKPAKSRGGRKRGPKATPERMAELVERDPSLNVSELARTLNVSRPTVYSWAERLGFERADSGEWVPA